MNDFAARMDWCVKPYAQANHPPLAVVSGGGSRTVSAGQTVALDASGSSDPDGNGLTYSWWRYSEPSSYTGPLTISNGSAAVASFVAPSVSVPQTIHIILEVKDSGSPALYAHERVVVNVVPVGHGHGFGPERGGAALPYQDVHDQPDGGDDGGPDGELHGVGNRDKRDGLRLDWSLGFDPCRVGFSHDHPGPKGRHALCITEIIP
jgi:hypothetical protein